MGRLERSVSYNFESRGSRNAYLDYIKRGGHYMVSESGGARQGR